MMDSGGGNSKFVCGEESGRELTARAEFLRCLCKELRQQNAEVLKVTAEACDTGDAAVLRQELCRVRQSTQDQQELLTLLENMLRTY